MNSLLDRLLDLNSLKWDAPGVELGFERPLPAWAWIGIIAVALALAFWSYSRLSGPAWARSALALLRAGVLLLLALLAAGPQLVQRSESVEKDWVLVLVDRSASMTIADADPSDAAASAQSSGGQRPTRQQQIEWLIQNHWPMWKKLAQDRVVVWMGFDAGAYDLRTVAAPGAPSGSPPEGIDLGAPAGRRTQLGAALEQAVARAAARPLSAVVIISDGRSSDEASRAAIRRLQADRVPVHTIALGSELPVGDIAIHRIDAPRLAFVGDTTPVRIDLERAGAAGAASARVRLIDKSTGIVLDERKVNWTESDPATRSVALTTREGEAGARTWDIELIPDGPDLVAGNNRAEANVELVDRAMRVLYIDGYPRWEQRYLKNLLIREKSINCSTLILAPDRRYIQEGDVEIEALPDSPEGWAEYDAVILGDLRPDVFTEEQLAQLKEHIARRGAGLIWIGGPGATPAAWWDTPLADLIPFRKDAIDSAPIGEPVLMQPTDAARRLGILQLGESAEDPWPSDLADPEKGWSLLRWAQHIEARRLKPAAETLADALPPGRAQEKSPLVLSMRYGAGRIIYVGTDESWRWRYAKGEQFPERFWVQIVRLLGRESLARSGRPAIVDASPRRSDVDKPVRIAVELLDQSLADLNLPSIAVRLTRRPVAGEQRETTAPIELVLRPEREGQGRTYAAIWLPPEAGTWNIEPIDPALSGLGLAAELAITLPDDELRHPETDHQSLARLSSETDGRLFKPAEITQLPERIPNRTRRTLLESTEALWDTPLALLSVILLLAIEWIGRRVIRLS